MERATGFEPATSTLARLRATNCAKPANARNNIRKPSDQCKRKHEIHANFLFRMLFSDVYGPEFSVAYQDRYVQIDANVSTLMLRFSYRKNIVS